MAFNTKEVICEVYSESWESEMPVKLIDYDDGGMDVHCQSGDHHDEAIEKAREILSERGIEFEDEYSFLGPSGLYYHVTKNDKND